MHAAARQIVDQHGGQIPRDLPALRGLPGIGRYTAGAILSIAFDARTPILEANSMRLLARLLAYGDDPTRAAGQRHLWAVAEQAVAACQHRYVQPGPDGAGQPDLHRPDNRIARGVPWPLCARRGTKPATHHPAAEGRPRTVVVREAVVVVRRRGTVLLLQYGEGQRWAGAVGLSPLSDRRRQAIPLAAN